MKTLYFSLLTASTIITQSTFLYAAANNEHKSMIRSSQGQETLAYKAFKSLAKEYMSGKQSLEDIIAIAKNLQSLPLFAKAMYFTLPRDKDKRPDISRYPKELWPMLDISIQDLIDSDTMPASERDLGIQTLNLSNQHINDLTGLTNIPGIDNIQTLYLSANKISEIQPYTFAGLNNLQMLFLDNNQIKDIYSNAFANLPRIQDIWLIRNKLTTIQADAYSELNTLQNIWLRNNQISEADREQIIREIQAVAPNASIHF